MKINVEEVEKIVAAIKGSKKYHDAPEDTIRELTRIEISRHKTRKRVEKVVRKHLHSIMAPYLGDPDYSVATVELEKAFQSGDPKIIRETCASFLACHRSTRERLPILHQFYSSIFQVTGRPTAILDIACGINPLAFPWMGLPTSTKLYAYDVHETRIDFINTFFSLQGLSPLARIQDVAFHYPEEIADVAFFLKEIPRFERNYGGSLELLEALRVRYLVVSFPTISHSGRPLTERYRQFFYYMIDGKDWPLTEIEFESELVFCIEVAKR